MPDGDVRFLDSLSISRRHVDQQVNLAGELSARFTRQASDECTPLASGLDGLQYIGAVSAGRERNEDVAGGRERFNLARKNAFKSKIISGGGQNGWIRRERNRRKTAAVAFEPHYELGGEMLCVSRASAIAEKDDLVAAFYCRGGGFCKARNL